MAALMVCSESAPGLARRMRASMSLNVRPATDGSFLSIISAEWGLSSA